MKALALALFIAAAMPVSGVAHAQDEPSDEPGAAKVAAADVEAERKAKTGWWAEAGKTRDQRIQWWRDARFGAFIHWGVYSDLAGEWQGKPTSGYAEHIMRKWKIPLATYRNEVAAKFNPTAYDANAWVAQMKAAGMRYIVITAKHHDGFAMWPSKANRYNIRDISGFKRDPMQELVDAARKAGLHIGFYYSHVWDWEDPGAPGNDWDYDNPGGDNKLHGGVGWWKTYPQFLANTDRYIDNKAIPQLKELIARYHPDILWFDTPRDMPFFQSARIVEAVRAAAPDVVINGRATTSSAMFLGDYRSTSDRPAETRPTEGDWEAIPTTNESYGYHKGDHSFKTPEHFIQLLAKAVAKGGNLLLNVGPRGDGTLDAPDVAILQGIAKWMAVNGDSIHGAGRTPLERQPWGDSTLKGNTLYLHAFRWPADRKLVVSGLTSEAKRAYLLSDARKTALPLKRLNPAQLQITVPAAMPDKIDTVVVLESAGPVAAQTGRTIDLEYGENQLLAFDAQAEGKGFRYGDGKTARYYVDGLEQPGNRLVWQVNGQAAGQARLRLRYSTAAPTATAGNFLVEYNGKTLTAPIAPTKSATDLATVELGRIALATGKPVPLTLKIDGAQKDSVHVFELLVDRP